MEEMKTLTINGKRYTVADPDAAHIDDLQVGPNAWSSKNTVDKLCPSFSENGSMVVCSPFGGLPLEVVSRIVPKQAGSGDPSLTNIRPITGYDSVRLDINSKNLLPYPYTDTTIYKNGVDFTDNGDGSVTLNGATTAGWTSFLFHAGNDLNRVKLMDGITYVFSLSNAPSTVALVFAYTNASGNIVWQNANVPFTWSDKNTLKECRIQIANAGSAFDNVTIYPQIEIGSTATYYEPYRNTLVTANIGQNVYSGTYKWNTGELTVDRETIVFDGIYNKFNDIGTANGLTYCVKLINPAKSNTPMCSHLKPQASIAYGNIYIAAVNWDQCLAFIQPFANTQEANAWLEQQYANGTPFTVCYELKEPITINLSPWEIYPLPGTNCISSNTGNTEISGKSDPFAAIKDLYNKLDTLTATVTALTGV